MAKDLTWREAIDKVLGATASPLHYKDIADKIISDGLRTNLGATPSATVNAQISSSIKHDISSPYVRVAKGTFALSHFRKSLRWIRSRTKRSSHQQWRNPKRMRNSTK